MKICYVINKFAFAGAEVLVGKLSRNLARDGHQIVMFSVRKQSLPEEGQAFQRRFASPGIRFVESRETSLQRSRSFFDTKAFLYREIQDFEPNIVHSHGFLPDMLSGMTTRHMHCIRLRTAHVETSLSLRSLRRNTIFQRLLNIWGNFDSIIAVSELIRRQNMMVGNRPPCLFIPNGVFEKEELAISAPRTPPEQVAIIGRLTPQKGQLAYIKHLASRYRHPETDMPFTLHLIGDGPDRKALQTCIRPFGHKVLLDGLITNHDQLYQDLDALIIPSLFEGMSTVMLEAAVRGIPFVSLPVSGAHEVCRFGSGIVVNTLQHMTDLLEQGNLPKINAETIRHVREFSSVERCIRQHRNTYAQFETNTPA